jgi:hypothetical protein
MLFLIFVLWAALLVVAGVDARGGLMNVREHHVRMMEMSRLLLLTGSVDYSRDENH